MIFFVSDDFFAEYIFIHSSIICTSIHFNKIKKVFSPRPRVEASENMIETYSCNSKQVAQKQTNEQRNHIINVTYDQNYQIRIGLFDKLAAHFPDELTHPRGSLIDLIPYSASLSNENSSAS